MSGPRVVAAPRVVAVLLVQGAQPEAAGSARAGGPSGRRLGPPGPPRMEPGTVEELRAEMLAEVLDAVAAQTRPPEQLVVVVPDSVATGPGGVSTADAVLTHPGLRAVVDDVRVLAVPEPVDLSAAIPLALAEAERAAPTAPTAPPRTGASAQPEPHQPHDRPDVAEASRAADDTRGTGTTDDPEAGGEPDGRPSEPSAQSEPRTAVRPTAGRPEWLWLLGDTTAPAPTALARLVEAVRRSPSVGIAGPKVVQWHDPRRLVELGRQVTRSGRRIDAPAFGDADQGQYDTRSDVLAVGAPGMLLRRDVHDALGGVDRAFEAAGGDLDLGWRAQLSGHRVVVVPGAVVRHQPLVPADRVLARRRQERRAARRVALTRCASLAVPVLAVWVLVSSIVSALGLLLLKRPQHAWSELADLGALVRPIGSAGARWRFRRGKVVRRRDLSGLFVTPGAAVAHTWDRVQEAVTPERDLTRTAAPTGDAEAQETGPVAEEAESLSGLPPSLPQRIATHPGFLAVLVCALLSALTFRTALTQGLLDARGPGLAGGELSAVATDSDGLWHLFRDAWHGAGLGNDLDVSPAVGVLAAVTWLAERLPYVSGGRAPVGVTLTWLLLLAMPLSATTAYLAGRAATRARWGRGLVALAWGTSGVLLAAVTQGRVSVVVAHLVLPLVVAGFVVAMKRQGTWTATFAAALAAGVLGAFVPVLLAVVVVAALVAVVVGPGFTRRLRAAVLAVVPVALLGPWVLRFVDDPRLLLTGPGLIDAGGDSVPAWQLVLAQPDGGRRLLGLVFVPVLVAAVIALARRSGGRSRSAALTALSAAALVGLAIAFASERVEVGQVVGDSGDLTLATLWSGVGLDLYVAAVLAVLLTGWHGLTHVLGERRWGWRRFVAGSVVAVLGVGVLAGGALSAWAGAGALELAENALPAVAVDQADGPDGNRLVVLTPSADRLDYALIGNEPGQLMRDVRRVVDVTDPGLGAVLGSVASGTTVAGGVGDALADLGVGFVSLRAPADSPLARTLDGAKGLTRLGSGDDQTLWRVVARASSVAADVPVPPARVRLDDANGAPLQALAVDGPHGAVSDALSVGSPGRRVVFAEAPEWADHAVVTFDGRALSPVSATGTPTYEIPATSGRLEADLPPSHQRWFLAQLILLAVVLFLAVPFGTRRSRRLS